MLKKIFDIFRGGNTLYYPGCLTKFALPKIQKNYEEILRKIGVDFIMLCGEEVCCGSPAIRAGYKKDFENLKQKNLRLFEEIGVTKIITNCPACLHILKEECGLEVEHVTQTIVKKIEKLPKGKDRGEVFYHDPCHLGRYSDIYQEPRTILEYLGYKVKELKDRFSPSLCCGAGGGMKTNYPKASNQIAQLVLKKVGDGELVSTCPLCYAHFKENALNAKIWEFSEIIKKSYE